MSEATNETRAVTFDQDVGTDYRAGQSCTLDRALAHHYCEVAKVAHYQKPADRARSAGREATG